jgi:hypothetical protein
MDKITEIKLVGQPIFKQIMNLVNKVDIEGLIRKHESDYYYKSFKTRTHLFYDAIRDFEPVRFYDRDLRRTPGNGR